MGWYDHIQEAHRDAQQMERCSILSEDAQDDDNTQESDMATMTIEGHIYAAQTDYAVEPQFGFYDYDVSKYREGTVQVCPYTISFELPAGFDPRPGMIESLKAEKAKILAEAQAKATAIEERISKMLAITYKGE